MGFACVAEEQMAAAFMELLVIIKAHLQPSP